MTRAPPRKKDVARRSRLKPLGGCMAVQGEGHVMGCLRRFGGVGVGVVN